MSSQQVEPMTSVIIKENEYKKSGYTFKGWSTSANGSVEYQPNQSVVFSQSVILYAVWEINFVSEAGPITVPGVDGELGTDDDITINNGIDGEKPTQTPEGIVSVPNGGTITLPNDQEITPPTGTTVKPDGTITTPEGIIINPDGSVVVPGANGEVGTGNDDVTIKPGANGELPTFDENGNVVVPEGGIVENGNGEQIEVPAGSIIKPDGTIITPDNVQINPDGTVTLPGVDGTLGNEDDVTVNPDGDYIINPDGSVTLQMVDK